MKKITLIAAAAALSLAAGLAQAQSGQSGWYAGIDIGSARSKANSLTDKSDFTFGVNGGYRFDGNFAVEAGYAKLGNFAPSYDATALSLSVLGILPLKHGFSVYGKLGYARTNVDGANTSDDANSLLAGVGAYYDASRRIFLKAGWDHYNKVGGINTGEGAVNLYNAGVGFRF